MSLLAPLYLLGLLALFLPWLLHRFNHHEPPEQPFPTTRFLEPTRPPATSKRKLRYWPLLALRALLLAGLCFLFAQPWLNSDDNAQDAEAVHLLIVDNSFSMRAGDAWDLAQDALNDALKDIPAQDAVQLFSFAGQLRGHTDLTNDRAALTDALTLVKPGYESADFGELMRRVNKLAGDIDKPVTAQFITDAQRSNLPVQMNTLLANRLEKFNVVEVKTNNPINYFLRADATSSDSVSARVMVNVGASGSTGGANRDSDTIRKTVEVLLKGEVVASEQIMLDPGDAKSVQFDAISLPNQLSELLEVRFKRSDFLSDDDKVRVPVRGLSSLSVSMTHIGEEPSEQAQVFIKTALETNGGASVKLLDASAALSPGTRHVVVFVDDLSEVPDAVSRFVNAGGNALLLPNRRDKLSSVPSVSAASFVSRIEQAHPLALGDINWFNTHFYGIPDFTPLSSDRVLLGLDSGEPVLIERNIGELGRLLLLNDVLDGIDTDLPLQPVFVSLLQQVIEYFDISNAIPAQIEVGQSLFLPANSQLLSPDGESMLALAQLGSASDVRMEEPGVYSVLGASQTNTVSVVLNPAESNLNGLTRDELDAWEARHDKTRLSDSDATEASTNSAVTNISAMTSAQDRQTMWRWLLPLVLLFLAAESLFANRMLWIRRDGL